jgi:hypothetical protein
MGMGNTPKLDELLRKYGTHGISMMLRTLAQMQLDGERANEKLCDEAVAMADQLTAALREVAP